MFANRFDKSIPADIRDNKKVQVEKRMFLAAAAQKVTPEDLLTERSQAKYQPILDKIHEYEKTSYLFRMSVQAKFLTNIIKCRLDWDLDSYVDHCYYYNNVRPFDAIHLRFVKIPCDELIHEVERQEAQHRRDTEIKEKTLLRKQRIKERRRFMNEMGIEGPVVLDEAVEKELEIQESGDPDKGTVSTLNSLYK